MKLILRKFQARSDRLYNTSLLPTVYLILEYDQGGRRAILRPKLTMNTSDKLNIDSELRAISIGNDGSLNLVAIVPRLELSLLDWNFLYEISARMLKVGLGWHCWQRSSGNRRR
jgi:hypothetical protein